MAACGSSKSASVGRNDCGGGSNDDGGAAATTSAAAATTTAAAAAKGSVDATGKATTIELSTAQQTAAKAAASGKLVGIVAATMDTDYHKTLNDTVKKTVESYGFTAEIFDANKDVNKQLQGVEGLMAKKPYAIVVTGLGGEGLGPVAKQASDQGILVVELTGRSLASENAVTISVEDADIANAEGKAAGQYAKQKYGDKAVQVGITDYPSIESLVTRADNIEKAFKAEYPAAEIVGRFLGGTAENGQKSIETALQKYPGPHRYSRHQRRREPRRLPSLEVRRQETRRRVHLRHRL